MSVRSTTAPTDVGCCFPRAAAFVADIQALDTPLLARQVELAARRHGEAFWREAERLLRLAEQLPGRPLPALLEYTVTALRAQAQFQASDRYSCCDFDAARRAVYDNRDVMEGFYLLGLLLTHAFWPIHFDIHVFFREHFLPRVAPTGMGTEVGYGHGLYLLDILTARPATRTVSFDISPHAQRFAARLLRAGGIAPDRFDLRLGDARARLPLADGQCRWMVCAEVLEHVPDPAGVLRELRRCLAVGSPLLIVTVVDGNALDHLYRFRSPAEIHALVEDCGLRIRSTRTLAVRDYEPRTRDVTRDVVLVAERDS